MTDLTTMAAELEALQERLRSSVVVQEGEPILVEVEGLTFIGTTGDTVAKRNPDGPAAADAIDTLLAALKAREEKLERIGKFVDDYFAPWGSWKTAWWEGEVSDEAAFSDSNALKHVANIARTALEGKPA